MNCSSAWVRFSSVIFTLRRQRETIFGHRLTSHHYSPSSNISVLGYGVVEAAFTALHLRHGDVTELLFYKLLSLKLYCEHTTQTITLLRYRQSYTNGTFLTSGTGEAKAMD